MSAHPASFWSWYPFGRLPPASPAESTDYETFNTPARRQYTREQKKDGQYRSIVRWTLLLVFAVILAALYAGIHEVIDRLTEAKFDLLHDDMCEDAYGRAWITYFGIMLALVLAACLGVIYNPAAGGSGMPEVVSYLNGVKTPRTLDLETGIIKALGLICSVSAGLAVGPEGPTIHLGAIVAYQTWRGALALMRATRLARFANGLDTDTNVRTMLSLGSCAGVAVAFRAPIGGVLFALEETVSYFSSTLIARLYLAAIATYLFLEIILSGRQIRVASFTEFELETSCATGFQVEDIVLFALIGCLGGMLGSTFNSINLMINRLRAKFIYGWGWRRLAEVACLALLTSLLWVFLPVGYSCSDIGHLYSHVPNIDEALSNDCFDDVLNSRDVCLAQETWVYSKGNSTSLEDTRAFLKSRLLYGCTCDNGSQYNELESLFHASGRDSIQLLFSTGSYDMFSASSLVIFGLVYFFVAVITAGTSVPAGLVVPMLAIGGAFGRLLGVFFNWALKDPTNGTLLDTGVAALLGAGAFWAGSTRISVTISVILFELTGDLRYLPAFAIAIICAMLVGNQFNSSLYHKLIHLKHYPFLEDPSTVVDVGDTQVKDIMSDNVVTVPPRPTADDVRGLLASTTHNGFPVVETNPDGSQHLVGLILRKQLVHLLTHEREPQAPLDLTQDMHETPYTIMPDSTSAQAFTMFRLLGLRHLIVVDRTFAVVGMLTRSNFLSEHHAAHGAGGGHHSGHGSGAGHDATTASSPAPSATPVWMPADNVNTDETDIDRVRLVPDSDASASEA